ncbi:MULTISPECIES: hypothetical protein [Bacillus cereus group]|uniref:Uncharacterized protein n=1 Tax=Bacillus thuringiensis TaxID=1428 RepID=A0A9X7AS48_BACTU|nr:MULTISPECIES: hypothetical protein [Bacillus cereus group]EKS7858204.1 hypothetical protein [Bacillus cereus]PFT50856.1 hypothetical protein COK72_02280 [Bacillus thuringiensis]PFY22893.1 hypothetical protein COL44_18600 [Bacillus toyonensis]
MKSRERLEVVGNFQKKTTWSHSNGFKQKLFLNGLEVENYFNGFAGKTVKVTVEVIDSLSKND